MHTQAHKHAVRIAVQVLTLKPLRVNYTLKIIDDLGFIFHALKGILFLLIIQAIYNYNVICFRFLIKNTASLDPNYFI